MKLEEISICNTLKKKGKEDFITYHISCFVLFCSTFVGLDRSFTCRGHSMAIACAPRVLSQSCGHHGQGPTGHAKHPAARARRQAGRASATVGARATVTVAPSDLGAPDNLGAGRRRWDEGRPAPKRRRGHCNRVMEICSEEDKKLKGI